jgi:hypothetical protein
MGRCAFVTRNTGGILERLMTVVAVPRVPGAAVALRSDVLMATDAGIFRVTGLARPAIRIRHHAVATFAPMVSVVLGRFVAVALSAGRLSMT